MLNLAVKNSDSDRTESETLQELRISASEIIAQFSKGQITEQEAVARLNGLAARDRNLFSLLSNLIG